MTEQEIHELLQPALQYPNCAVRQARLTQMLRALLLNCGPNAAIVGGRIRQVWVDQDEQNAMRYPSTYTSRHASGS